MRIVVDGNLSKALHVLREGGRVSEAKQRRWFVPRAERRRLKAKLHRARQLHPWDDANLQLGSPVNPRIGRDLTPTNEPAPAITLRLAVGRLDGDR